MRLIDADQMALDESEAYMAAQVQIQDNVLRGINEIVHRKIQMLLADTPAVDAVPVVHGRWIEDHDYLKCPKCGVMVKWDFTFFDIGNWNYCPNCGAKMDEKGEEA